MQEALEAAVVDAVRALWQAKQSAGAPVEEAFRSVLELYARQPVMAARTSGSVALQQYSTPVPLALAAQLMAGVDESQRVFEPTAGNGSLLMLADPRKVEGYEIEPDRLGQARLLYLGVRGGDATRAPMPQKAFDIMLCNPPFGALRATYTHPDSGAAIPLTRIDRLIALRALETLKDEGRAVLVLGVDSYRAGPGEGGPPLKRFLAYLHDHFRVIDHVEVDGRLYARQGAAFPIRMITIAGRGSSPAIEGIATGGVKLYENGRFKNRHQGGRRRAGRREEGRWREGR